MAEIEAEEKESNINHTYIEWVRNENGSQGYTINPVKGLCPVDCKDNQGKSYCYARRMYKRFKWNQHIRLDTTVFAPLDWIKPSRVFVGSTVELFGDWVKPGWMRFIMERVRLFNEHTFIFLTKRPGNLLRWSPFPDNCWVGVSATNVREADSALRQLYGVRATVRFISLEPLLGWNPLFPIKFPPHLNWVIIGAQTPYSSKTAPKIEWVNEICMAANEVNIPVFLKNNLRPLFDDGKLIHSSIGRWEGIMGEPLEIKLRQEFPK